MEKTKNLAKHLGPMSYFIHEIISWEIIRENLIKKYFYRSIFKLKFIYGQNKYEIINIQQQIK